MNILVVDSQGGGIGKQLITAIKHNCKDVNITAVGTNVMATSAMLKAVADNGATGENAIIVGCRNCDIIVGPIGIVIADSMYGEITPKMATAIGQSNAVRILVPINHCNNLVVGVSDLAINTLVQNVVEEILKLL